MFWQGNKTLGRRVYQIVTLGIDVFNFHRSNGQRSKINQDTTEVTSNKTDIFFCYSVDVDMNRRISSQCFVRFYFVLDTILHI